MRRETEIKLTVHNPSAIRRRLGKLGFRRASGRRLERNLLFDYPDLRLRRQGSLLRVRRENKQGLLTFKGPRLGQGRFKERPEIECVVSDGPEAARIFEALGLRVAFRYEKYRTLYRRPGDADHAEVAFDETPIGTYLELEGPRRWIDETAKGLGYQARDYITASYGALYLEWCKARRRKPANMIFEATEASPGKSARSE